jgi:predicted O-methyltransferase YrrM
MRNLLHRARTSLMPTPAPSPARFDLANPRDLAQLPRPEAQDAVRLRLQTAFLDDRRILCRALGRYKLFLNPHDRAFTPHLLLDGYWQMWVTQFIARTLAPGMTVIDVGAHVGYYATLLADLVGPQGRCVAIESDDPSIALMRSNLSVNGLSGRAEIVKSALDAVDLNALGERLERIDFIKIDARGAERDILRRAQRQLARRPRLLLNFNAQRIPAPRDLLQDLYVHYSELRIVRDDARAAPTSIEELLSTTGDQFLYLAPAQA